MASGCGANIIICFTVFVLFIFNNAVKSSETEAKLLRDLFTHYDKTVRPAKPNEVILTKLCFQLNHIEFDDSEGLFTAFGYFEAEWEDPKLKWKPSEYDSIEFLHLKRQETWLPDISLYNSIGSKAFDLSKSGNTLLDSTGQIIWSMNIKMQTLCDLDMFHWPYDIHKCRLNLGSWTYDALEVDFIPSKLKQPVDFTQNSEFIVTNFTMGREETVYNCCPEPYVTVDYYIEFARRSSAFVSVFLMPAFCVVVMTLAAFWIPPHRGEKILLNGLALVVIAMYQIYFIANHSTFSRRIPLIAIFYSVSFILASLSMIISVLVLASSRSLCKGRLPPGLSKVLKSRIGLMLGPVDVSKKSEQTELGQHLEGEKSHETYSLICTNNSYDEWTALGIILDRVSFFVYTLIYALIALVCIF